jgi:hypothetical protein
MGPDRFQTQRFELKYIIPEDVALPVRDFVRSYLDCDEFGATMPNLSYPVHSLYLDSDDLKLYHATINGDKNRFKLRLRFYDNRAEAPVFFEIKRRMNNTISKQRGGARRDAVDLLLAGHYPAKEHMVSKEPKQFVALQNFCRLMTNLQAHPKAHIAYLREAWISRHDNSVRVTMDRDVCCDPDPTTRLTTELFHPSRPFGNKVILELKFTNRFPEWFGDLVRVFGLMQCGAAKYVDGVAMLGEHVVKRSFVFDDRPKFAKVPAAPEQRNDTELSPSQPAAGTLVK